MRFLSDEVRVFQTKTSMFLSFSFLFQTSYSLIIQFIEEYIFKH